MNHEHNGQRSAKEKQAGKPNAAWLNFWMTCHNCKTKIPTPPKYVLLYLNRLAEYYEVEIPEIQEMLEATQERVQEAREKVPERNKFARRES